MCFRVPLETGRENGHDVTPGDGTDEPLSSLLARAEVGSNGAAHELFDMAEGAWPWPGPAPAMAADPCTAWRCHATEGTEHGRPEASARFAVTEAWTGSRVEKGADVVCTMLNASRQGAIAACRARGARQIGNAMDWVARDPEVFVASALARIDRGTHRAVADLAAGRQAARVVPLGLAQGDHVGLSVAADVVPLHRAEIAATGARLRSGEIEIAATYDGPDVAPG